MYDCLLFSQDVSAQLKPAIDSESKQKPVSFSTNSSIKQHRFRQASKIQLICCCWSTSPMTVLFCQSMQPIENFSRSQ
jgi:hypothetical protein